MITCLLFGDCEGYKPSTLHRFLNYIVQVSVSANLVCNRDHLLHIDTCLSCQQASENELLMTCCFFSHECVFGELSVSLLRWSPCFADTSTPSCLLPPHTLLVGKIWLLDLTDHSIGPYWAALSPWLLSPFSLQPAICFPCKKPVGSPHLELSTLSQLFLICCCIHSFPMHPTGSPKKA